MICPNCGADAYRTRTVWTKHGPVSSCNNCDKLPPVVAPDVYFNKPYHDEHLADEKHPHGRFVMSKGHKAQIMKELGLRETGDRVHGSRTKYEKNYGIRGIQDAR